MCCGCVAIVLHFFFLDEETEFFVQIFLFRMRKNTVQLHHNENALYLIQFAMYSNFSPGGDYVFFIIIFTKGTSLNLIS